MCQVFKPRPPSAPVMFSSLMVLKMTTVMKRCPFKVDVNDDGGDYCDVGIDFKVVIDYTFTQYGVMKFKMEVKVEKV